VFLDKPHHSSPAGNQRPGPATLRWGGQGFPEGRPLVMAIVNRTPDSFFDQGATFDFDAALSAVGRAVGAGADVVDIGGVKAGPGEEVSVAEEVERTAPLVHAVRARFPTAVVSVDTWRAQVAEECVDAGADVINDSWGGVDPGIAEVAARRGVGLVCTHAGGQQPRTRPHRVGHDDVVGDVIAATVRLAERAVTAGVSADSIVIDPGHDFGKNTWHSLELTRRLSELVDTGWPVLVSMSNKDFVGESLDRPVAERGDGTLAATAIAAWLGARVFRTHDVRATRDVVDMAGMIRGTQVPRATRRGLA